MVTEKKKPDLSWAEDEIFAKALAYILRESNREGMVSAAELQNQFGISFAHANKIMEQLEGMGYVSRDINQTGYRRVLVLDRYDERQINMVQERRTLEERAAAWKKSGLTLLASLVMIVLALFVFLPFSDILAGIFGVFGAAALVLAIFFMTYTSKYKSPIEAEFEKN